jgi:hypothetical protein
MTNIELAKAHGAYSTGINDDFYVFQADQFASCIEAVRADERSKLGVAATGQNKQT